MPKPWEKDSLVTEKIVPDGKWTKDQLVEPTAFQKFDVAAGSVVGGFAETAPMVPGTFAGAAVGTAIAPGPGTLLGAMAGFGISYFAGQELRDHLVRFGFAQPRPEEVPENLRPYAYGGEVIGAGIPFAGAPVVAGLSGARLPATKAGNYINRILETAAKHPGQFISTETGMLISAGLAGGIAEEYYPGQALVRLPAEIVGGLFNPARLVMGTTNVASQGVKRLYQSYSRTGRESKAAQMLQDIVTQAGEDPIELARLLRESGLPGIELTSAQKTGSDALLILETKLASESAHFGAMEAKRAESGLSALKDMIHVLRKEGSPEALREAARLQSDYYRTVIATRIQNAERIAVQAAARLGPDVPTSRTLISQQAKELLEEAMTDVRKVEKELWGKIPKELDAGAENILNQYSRLRNEMLPEERMPEVVEGFAKRMQARMDETGTFGTTAGELIRFRSRLLELARESSGRGELNDARIYGNLAEAALDDLGSIQGLQTLDDARAFSRELNQTFTATFAGEALRKTKTGAARIPPELLMRRALGAGSETSEMRFRQLELAADFLHRKGLEGTERLEAMMDVQNNFIRLLAQESIDMSTGRASIPKLRNFLNKNKELLSRFPEVKAQMKDAIATAEGVKNLERLAKGEMSLLEKQGVFSRLSKYESGADAVNTALRQPSPVDELNAIINVAQKGGREAVDGFKASVWDEAIRRSTRSSGEMDFVKLKDYFFKSIRPGQPSLMTVLERKGMVSAVEIAQVKRIISQAEKILKTLQRPISPAELAAIPTEGLSDLIIRVMGARLGSTIAKAGGPGGGHELIAAGAGVRFMRRALEKVPQENIQNILIEAMINPKFAALLLEKPKTQQRAIELAHRVHAYILQTGVTVDPFAEEQGP